MKETIETNPKFAFLKKIVEDITIESNEKDEGGSILKKRKRLNDGESGDDDEQNDDYEYDGNLSYVNENKK